MSQILFDPTYDPTTWTSFGQFSVSVARSADDRHLVNGWLEAEHFLGSFKPVGHSLIHIIREDDKPVAVVQWAACAYRLKDREAFIGWTPLQCAKRRNLVVNNVRFLVLEAARRPNLASKALAHSVKALAAHWMEHFHYEPLLVETFTDIESHAGTCYKAAGWTPLGLTKGNSRQRAEFYVPNQRPKKLWVKELRADAKQRLCAQVLAPEHAPGLTEGKGAPLLLKVAQQQSLLAVLRKIKDPRARSRFYPIGTMLVLLALGLLCGEVNLNKILRRLRKLSQEELRSLEVPRRAGTKLYGVPSYESFRQLLMKLDLDDFACQLSAWLSAHRGALPAHLAMDGKRIKGTLATIVTLCDTASKVPVAIAATIEPGGEQACARAMLRRDQTVLLNATVSTDALYTNAENAHLIVAEKGGEMFSALKGNQPTLYAEAVKLFTQPAVTEPGQPTPAPLMKIKVVSVAESEEEKSQPMKPAEKEAATLAAKPGKPAPSQKQSKTAKPKTREILVPNKTKGNAAAFKKKRKPATVRSLSGRL